MNNFHFIGDSSAQPTAYSVPLYRLLALCFNLISLKTITCLFFCRCYSVLYSRLCQNSVEHLVRAGHWYHHSGAGRSAASYENHRRHLGLLCLLCTLPKLLPVSGAYCHVSAKNNVLFKMHLLTMILVVTMLD